MEYNENLRSDVVSSAGKNEATPGLCDTPISSSPGWRIGNPIKRQVCVIKSEESFSKNMKRTCTQYTSMI